MKKSLRRSVSGIYIFPYLERPEGSRGSSDMLSAKTFGTVDENLLPFSSHHIHHSDGSNLDDRIDIVTGLQHMDRSAHPQQDRADRFGFAQASQQLVGDVR